ncbi:MAG: 1,4-dihydroxy-2-naphtoate prenyltransferase [Crocinitomicaceae bacterium]|jgi:1,4-dihydroxy-2-naphthoate octaprenyltransferase|nr:1,4-dihydroxy-2-naphtoate prenyltransferase [Crocinitomicaceae bacterium]
MSNAKAWIGAFRLRTLPLSVSGIIMGSFIAKLNGFWDSTIFTLALSTTLLFQVVSNLANDLGDSQKGTDNEQRVGPVRAVQSGVISQAQMKAAVILFAILSLISAGVLIYFGTQNLPQQILILYAVLALLCVAAAIMYTVGKKAYGYHGFGDVFVFIFFGLVSVLGVYTFYSKNFDWTNLLPAATIGLLSTAVLNLNNMRDRVNDAHSGKNTLVVKMGGNWAKLYHALLILGGIACLLAFVFPLKQEWLFLAFIPCLVLLIHLKIVMNTRIEKDFDPQLKVVALSTFAISLFFMAGVLIIS